MIENFSVLILAAGKGKRMQSDHPKVLQPLAGRPLLSHVLQAAWELRPKRTVVVVGHKAAEVKGSINDKKISWVLQRTQRGTADAVLAAEKILRKEKGSFFILSGDVPLLTAETLRRMKGCFDRENAALALLTTTVPDSTGYGRVVRNGSGGVEKIVEEKEATEAEKGIREINTGIYCIRPEEVLGPLKEIKKSRLTGEFYLTDLVELLLNRGRKVVSVLSDDYQECLGVNSREELALLEERIRKMINRDWMRKGVTLRNPDTISIGADVVIELDAIIHQGVVIEGKSHIGSGVRILPYSVIEESRVRAGARVGPFAHLRPGSDVGEGCHIGNFVELKKATLKKGAKANHLSYLGDAVIGEGSNVGAGTITCNYDGFHKHKTEIGKKVFIGSDVQFVAPVKVENSAWIAAGTTVTRRVPSGALALSRVEQKNVKGWVRKKMARETKGRG